MSKEVDAIIEAFKIRAEAKDSGAVSYLAGVLSATSLIKKHKLNKKQLEELKVRIRKLAKDLGFTKYKIK